MNKPFSTLIEHFKKEKIDTKKIFVIDAATPVATTIREQNAVFVGSPRELTNISITTTSLIKKLAATRVLILDSVSTLLNYNDFKTVTDFIHFITNKMRDWKITFAMICIKEMTDERTLSQFKQFCDDVIEIE